MTERIHTYFHCAQCLKEKPVNQTPREHARVQAGLTDSGIQIWCNRHRRQVAHFTPEQLMALLVSGPSCDCCPEGRHVLS